MADPIEIPWGAGTLRVPLPATWRVLGELRPRSVPAPDDVAAACMAALREPIGAQRLAARDLSAARVVIVTDDHSRPTPVRRTSETTSSACWPEKSGRSPLS